MCAWDGLANPKLDTKLVPFVSGGRIDKVVAHDQLPVRGIAALLNATGKDLMARRTRSKTAHPRRDVKSRLLTFRRAL